MRDLFVHMQVQVIKKCIIKFCSAYPQTDKYQICPPEFYKKIMILERIRIDRLEKTI